MNNIDLKKIIEQYPDCINNGSKLKGIILDLYPDTPKAVINTLVLMVNSGMAKEIQDSENVTELDKSRWQKQLENEGFAENVICICLNIFFFAVGLKVICVQNDTKVDTSYIIEKKIEKQVLPTDLSDFEIKDGVLLKYKGIATNVVIPDCVTVIGYRAFSKFSKLTSVTISNSVTSIDDFAFGCCSGIANMVIPDRVTCIGSQSFMGCRKLKNVVIPNSVTYIGNWAFRGCSDLSKIIFNGTIEKWNNINKGIDYLKKFCCKKISFVPMVLFMFKSRIDAVVNWIGVCVTFNINQVYQGRKLYGTVG